jgi:hypothetical protein
LQDCGVIKNDLRAYNGGDTKKAAFKASRVADYYNATSQSICPQFELLLLSKKLLNSLKLMYLIYS